MVTVLAQSDPLAPEPGNVHHGVAGLVTVVDLPASNAIVHFAAEVVDLRLRHVRQIVLDKYRIGQRHLEGSRAVVDQLLPIRRLDVVRLNLQQHFAIQVHRVALGHAS